MGNKNVRLLLLGIFLLLTYIVLVQIASAQCLMCGGFNGGVGMGGMFLWLFFGIIITILIIIVLVLFILWFIRQLEQPKLRTRGKNFRK